MPGGLANVHWVGGSKSVVNLPDNNTVAVLPVPDSRRKHASPTSATFPGVECQVMCFDHFS